jgi:phosphonate transport system substrate-binding protein
METTMKRRAILSAAGLVAAVPSLWAQTTGVRPQSGKRSPKLPKLTFGLITPRNADVMLKNWNPFLDRMQQALGIPIERQTYPTAGELVKDFTAGRIDLAWLGNAPALEIVESGTGSVFAVEVVQGKTAYRSVLITPRDSALRSLDDVHRLAAQLTFGDGDEKSTSGHIVPRYFAFIKRGVNDPDKMFKQVHRGNHESNLIATAHKEVDVATNNTSELENFRSSKPAEAALVRTIWESPDIPTSPMVWRRDLPGPVKQQLAFFLERFGAKDDEEKGILWNINKLTGWRASTNRQLIPIADLEMFNARQKIMNDMALDAGERMRRVDEVTRRGSKLELMIKASV